MENPSDSKKANTWLAVVLIMVLIASVVFYYVFDKYDYPYLKDVRNIYVQKQYVGSDSVFQINALLEFYNPAPVPSRLNSLYYRFIINGVKLETVVSPLNLIALPENNQLVPAIGQIPFDTLLEKIDLKIVGSLTTQVAKMDVDMPFSFQYDLMIPDSLFSSQ